MKRPKFVIHDVLQVEDFSPMQKKSIARNGDFYTQFKEAVKLLDPKDDVRMLIVAEGITKNPEWATYIKSLVDKNPSWKVECHGMRHYSHNKEPFDKLVKELGEAKKLIENYFGQKVMIFHPPKDKYGGNVLAAAEECGMSLPNYVHKPGGQVLNMNPSRFMEDPANYFSVDFHFWYDIDKKNMVHLNRRLDIKEVTFIVGAPRSGTTAMLRFMAQTRENHIVLKEVEAHWHKDKLGRRKCPIFFYLDRLEKEGKDCILDKNARNSVRIDEIKRLFPEAKFIHMIRDGRAVASSWKVHNTKLDRYDTTIEQASYQWIHFLTYIRERFNTFDRYEEVRYEEMCEQEEYFKNKNFKWKELLTDKEKESMMAIQKPLLTRLGYK